MRLRTVLRPDARKDETTGEYALSDYIAVPAVELNGVWPFRECVAAEELAALARWANDYERRRKAGLRLDFKTVEVPAELLRGKGKK